MSNKLNLGRVKGSDGKSAYQTAVEGGYQGTQEEFCAALESLNKSPFLSISGGSMTGPISMGGQKITMVPDPVVNTDVATMGYVNRVVGEINTLLDTINGEVV